MAVSLQRIACHDMLSLNNAYSEQRVVGQRRIAGDGENRNYPLRVLLLTAYRWPTTTRMAHALASTGVEVEALCPAGHSLMQAKFISRTYRYNPLMPLRSLRKSIATCRPDVVIPADDLITAQLHKLYNLTDAADPAADNLRNLIARSLGRPENYLTFYVRSQIAQLAKTAGVFSPAVTKIGNENDLFDQLRTVGYPAVLKTDGSSGGAGVAIVHNEFDAKRAFARLSAPPRVALTLKRLMIDGDANLVLPCLRRAQSEVSIQPYIAGRQANIAVACWEGSVLAQVCVEVLSSNGETGPATVVRVISHPGMSQAAEKMVGLLNVSGLCGFDFILDSEGAAHLIDFNPRATQTCHLISVSGTQPLASLIGRLGGSIVSNDLRTPHTGPIVLFPHGFVRDATGFYSEHAFSDVPPDAAEFMNFGLEFRRKKSRLLVRVIRSLSRKVDKEDN